MNANITKNNTGKLLVAVLAMFMLIAGATVALSDNTDAAETSYIHGGLTAGTSGSAVNVQTYSADSVVVVDGDYVIPKYSKLVINGSFTVDSGCTVSIEPGGQLEFGTTAKVIINGSIEAEGDYTGTDITNYDTTGAIQNNTPYAPNGTPKTGVTVAGSLILDNESIMTGTNGVIFIKGSANVEINDGSKVTGQSFILDNGASLLYNGTTDNIGFKISMNTSGNVYATVEAQLVCDNGDGEDISDLKFTASSKNISGYTWNETSKKAEPQTIKQFTLGVSGTVDNSETLTFTQKVVNTIDGQSSNTTFYTSAQYAEDYETLDTSATVFMYDSLVKGKVAVENLTIENNASLSNSAYMVVNGKVSVPDVPKNAESGIVVGKVSNDGGIVEVVGSIILAPASFEGADEFANYGTIAINGGTVQYEDGDTGGTFLYGAYYFDDDKNLKISSLESALTGAVTDGADEVVVYATAYSEDIKVGSYVITADLTIPEDVDLVICNGLIVSEGVTMTIPADNKVDLGDSATSTDGMLYVDGKVVDNSRELEDAENTSMTFQVKIVTGEGRDTINTYTTLKAALAETTSGTIYLYNDVKVEGTLTIPENVTVQYSEDTAAANASIIMMDKSTLNVNGTLFLDGTHGLKADADAEDYTVNSNNIIKAADDQETTETIAVDVAGAWFVAALGDDEDTYQYITSVAVAAQNSASLADYPTIDIMGTVSMGAVTFTAPEDTTLTVNIINTANTGGNQKATGDVTLVGKVIFDMADGMYDGTVTSDVTAGTTTVDFENSLDAIITIDTEETVEGVDTTMVLSTDGESDGTINVMSGTVTIDSEIWISKLVITTGATVIIADGGNLTTGVNQGFKANTILKELPVFTEGLFDNLTGLVVDGTLTVDEGATLTGNLSIINGTVNVIDGATDVDMSYAYINGTLNVEDGASIGYLMMFVNGTITGSVEPIAQPTSAGTPVTVGAVITFPGSDVSAAEIYYGNATESIADVTTFHVNGAEWATVYATEDNVDVLAMLLAIDIAGCDETTALFYSDSGMTQEIVTEAQVTALVNGVKGLTIDQGTTAFIASLMNLGKNTNIFNTGYTVGTFENVYIGMEASEIAGTITVYQGMGLYIDGKAIQNFYDDDKKAYILPVGQHTFSVQIDPGLTGTYEVTLDGQVVDGTFTISDDAKEFQIVVTGNLTQESVVVDQGGNGGSDGMGLTDYLLIILVILIVVMAIMVAMRLMRS